MKKTLLTLLMMSSMGAAMAQAGAYATIVNVEGLVTVTTDNQLSNAVAGMPLTKGGQVMATGSGTVTIAFSNGCVATLKPGQTLLTDEAACATFTAAAAAATGFASLSTSATVGLAGAGGLALLVARNNNNAATPAEPEEPGSSATPEKPKKPKKPKKPAPVSGS